jgi:hypothetical protein
MAACTSGGKVDGVQGQEWRRGGRESCDLALGAMPSFIARSAVVEALDGVPAGRCMVIDG